MSYYTMAFFGAAPLGSLLAGMLAHRIGAPHTVMLTGAFCLAGALWFTFQLPRLHSDMGAVYRDKGLLPVDDEQLVRRGTRACRVTAPEFLRRNQKERPQ